MTAPRFTWSWSIGNIIQIALLLVAGGISWATVDGRLTALEKAIVNGDRRGAEHEVRLRSVETNYARTDERLTSILALLGRIDAKLERIERNPTTR